MPKNGHMDGHPRWVVALWAGLLFVGGCSGSGAGGSDDTGSTGRDADHESTADAAASGDDPIVSGDAADLTGPGGSGGTDTPAGFDPSKPVRRGDVPTEGRYWYDYSELGSGTTERIIEVVDVGSGDGWLRQLRTYATHSVATRSLDVWLAGRLFQEVEQRARADEVAAACVWDPGFTLLALPFEEGAAWKSDSRCDTEAAERRRTLDAKVSERRSENVAGEVVDVFVVEQTVVTTTRVRATTPLVTVETATTTDLYSVDRKVLVESSGVKSSTVNGAPQGVPQNFTLRLRSLEPDALGTPSDG